MNEFLISLFTSDKRSSSFIVSGMFTFGSMKYQQVFVMEAAQAHVFSSTEEVIKPFNKFQV